MYTMEYYSAVEKEQIWVSCSDADEPKASYTEESKSETDKQVPSINAYIWNLENQYWQTKWRLKKEATYTWLCLIRTAVWQKPIQHCK